VVGRIAARAGSGVAPTDPVRLQQGYMLGPVGGFSRARDQTGVGAAHISDSMHGNGDSLVCRPRENRKLFFVLCDTHHTAGFCGENVMFLVQGFQQPD